MSTARAHYLISGWMPRLRRYLWTLNNYTQEEVEHLLHLGGTLEAPLRFLIWGEEVAPTTGTPHLQGYVEFLTKISDSQCRTLLGARVALTFPVRANSEAQVLYCSKTRPEDTVPNEVFHSFGEPAQANQGKRNDLTELKDIIDDGGTMLDCYEQNFGSTVRYSAGLEKYKRLKMIRISEPTYALESFPQTWREAPLDFSKAVILWGPPGAGKTHFALTILSKCLMVSHMDDLQSFDPLRHEGILFDDMDFNHYPISAQIHLCDVAMTRSIHCRFFNAVIPSGTKRIFTTNVQSGLIFNMDANFGVKRRCDVHFLGHFQ